MNIIDKEGYQLAKKTRRSGHFTPEIFAVDADFVNETATGVSLE